MAQDFKELYDELVVRKDQIVHDYYKLLEENTNLRYKKAELEIELEFLKERNNDLMEFINNNAYNVKR